MSPSTLNSIDSYGVNFQTKSISALLTHKEFLLTIQDVLSEDYFQNQAQKWIIREIIKYFQNHHYLNLLVANH